jgi:hypothetical protein
MMSTPKKPAARADQPEPLKSMVSGPPAGPPAEPNWLALLLGIAMAGIRAKQASGERLTAEQQALLDAAGG